MTYSLNSSAETRASFEDGELFIALDDVAVKRLTETDEVGVEAHIGELHLLIEKDFTCLQVRPEEQNGDYYPNPLEQRS